MSTDRKVTENLIEILEDGAKGFEAAAEMLRESDRPDLAPVRDTLSGSDPDGVLNAAEQGEDAAVEAYEDALEQEISPNLRVTLQRQFAAVKAAHDEVKALRNTVS